MTGEKWTHVHWYKTIDGRAVWTGCMGWHTTPEEKDALGHCLEHCGADECAVLEKEPRHD